MASPVVFPADDKDLDDAALWAVIDSAVADSHSSNSRETLALRLKHAAPSHHHHQTTPSPITKPSPSPPPPLHPKFARNPRPHCSTPGNYGVWVTAADGEVLQARRTEQRPQKIARSCVSEIDEDSRQLAVVKREQQSPKTPMYYSSKSMDFRTVSDISPFDCRDMDPNRTENAKHCLSGQFPTVSVFREYQNAAMAILEKTDYTMISGNPFIKKTGWRKMSCYFNVSYEIKDKSIEFDENRNVLRAEFIIRAHMQSGRFSDGWGSCERKEKRFLKPNHDIPSTAETRAKNKACQDLLGIGEYRPGASNGLNSR